MPPPTPPPQLPPLPPRRLLILYGSETGTAADLAHELSRTAERLHFASTCLPASSLTPFSSLPLWPIVIFIAATTGQGEMCTNMLAFWKFMLRKKLPSDWLSNTEFTTFGCGDSTYLKFNWAVRKVHKRFLQLGAKEVAGRGEGDEQHAEGVDGAFLPWSTRLLEVLLERHPLPDGIVPIPADQLLPPKYILELDEAVLSSNGAPPKDITSHIQVPRPGALLGTVSQNTRVTPESHWQDVRHITINLPTKVSYSPGDTISILPKNFPEDVNHLLELQSWDQIADRPLRLIPNPQIPVDRLPPSPIPHTVFPLTLRTLLTHHLDITSIPRRSFFSIIANLSNDETHRERLAEFTNPEYIDELYDYTTRPRRSILEVLQEFSSVKVPLDMLLEVIPRTRERLFSIASSEKGHRLPPLNPTQNGTTTQPPPTNGEATQGSNTVEILAAIVKYRTVIKKIRQGVCTRWLSSLPPGAPISVAFQHGTLTSPRDDLAKPAIMIAPGTGVAPMRALVWQRVHLASTTPDSVIPTNILFFGSRSHSADFYFRTEWETLTTHDPSLLILHTAFSRDQKAKRYVQHVIRERGREVFEALVERQGVVYVCGSSGRMPSAVREALVEVLERESAVGRGGVGWSREEAEGWLKRLETEGRWRQETWG